MPSRHMFRVIVVMPVHPEGDPDSEQSVQVRMQCVTVATHVLCPMTRPHCCAGLVQIVMHFQYATICRGPNSLFGMLQSTFPGVNVDDYISFYNLRNVGTVKGVLSTEQVRFEYPLSSGYWFS